MSERTAPGRSALPWVSGFVLALLLVVVLGLQAWAAWKRDVSAPLPPGVGAGTLIAVTLVNGQVYYGTLAGADAHQLSLSDVYYVQTGLDPSNNQRNNRLVSRQQADWHAPLRTTFPADKVMMVELVGPDSQLAQLIAQERQNRPPRTP